MRPCEMLGLRMNLEVIRRDQALVAYMVVEQNSKGTRLLRPVPEKYMRVAIQAWKLSREPESVSEPPQATLRPISETVRESKKARSATNRGRAKSFTVQIKRTVHDTRLPHRKY